MHTIVKRFKFESAHQLVDAYSLLCKETIHGHSYKLEVEIKSEILDSTGMVIDFGRVKKLFSEVVDDILDHSLMMSDKTEEEYLITLKKYNKRLLLLPFNPTAENLSKWLYEYFNSILYTNRLDDVSVSVIRLWETETGYAEYKKSCEC